VFVRVDSVTDNTIRGGHSSSRTPRRHNPAPAVPLTRAISCFVQRLLELGRVEGVRSMRTYRQLFDFLCLASIAISVPKTERERHSFPKHAHGQANFHASGTSASSGVLICK
jgi:hypothetical protein